MLESTTQFEQKHCAGRRVQRISRSTYARALIVKISATILTMVIVGSGLATQASAQTQPAGPSATGQNTTGPTAPKAGAPTGPNQPESSPTRNQDSAPNQEPTLPAPGQTGPSPEQTPPFSASSILFKFVHPPGTEGGTPITLTLQEALERARKNDVTYLAAQTDAKVAREDRKIARAGLLPTVSFTTQELLAKGNGTLPSGRFVTNDGLHVYRAWGVVHQDFSPNTYLMNGYKRASAAEALAQAKAEIARRGLVVTVTKTYYALLVAQRKYAAAQQGVEESDRLLSISRELEQGGEAAHSDVIKAELQFTQLKQAFQESELALDNTRLALAVLLSPNLNENITVVDDLSTAGPLPPFDEVRSRAAHANPDIRAAMETLRQTSVDVSAARGAFLPSLIIDVDYGIEANSYALRSVVNAARDVGPLPNLGHFITGNLTVPVWDWGALRSKVRQAEYKRERASAQLSLAQRQVLSNLYSFYNEATAARSELETTRHAAELAVENARLILMRYQAGEATIADLVEAQNSLTQARNADADGQARYRVSLANLQTLTGSF